MCQSHSLIAWSTTAWSRRIKNTEIASDHYPVVVELKRSHVSSPELWRQAIDQTWFNFKWDFKKIWQLDLEAEDLALKEIDWHLDVPLWEHKGEPNSITPREVLQNPTRNREHYLKTMDADLVPCGSHVVEWPLDAAGWCPPARRGRAFGV